MKIEIKKNKCLFKELGQGSIFGHGEKAYVKTETGRSSNENVPVNSANLTTGALVFFEREEPVFPLGPGDIVFTEG